MKAFILIALVLTAAMVVGCRVEGEIDDSTSIVAPR
jgi:hypothetical protein